MNGKLNAIAADNLRIVPIHLLAAFLAFSQEAGACDSSETLRENGSCYFNSEPFAGRRFQPHSAVPETVLRHFVAMADDIEPGLFLHQFGQIESDHACVVGYEPN